VLFFLAVVSWAFVSYKKNERKHMLFFSMKTDRGKIFVPAFVEKKALDNKFARWNESQLRK
jgi:hypothetical protein